MARITSRQAQELMDAYAKVYETKEEPAVETPVNETPVEDIQETVQDIQEKERPQSKFMQTYLRNKAGQDDLNNKADEWKKKNPNKELKFADWIATMFPDNKKSNLGDSMTIRDEIDARFFNENSEIVKVIVLFP